MIVVCLSYQVAGALLEHALAPDRELAPAVTSSGDHSTASITSVVEFLCQMEYLAQILVSVILSQSFGLRLFASSGTSTESTDALVTWNKSMGAMFAL